MQKCPAENCSELIADDQPFCRRHFFSLRKDLRRKILSGYGKQASDWIPFMKQAKAILFNLDRERKLKHAGNQ
jgi:hypothetical protein